MLPDLDVRDEGDEPASAPAVAPPVGEEPAADPLADGEDVTELNNPLVPVRSEASPDEPADDAPEDEPSVAAPTVEELLGQVNALTLELKDKTRRANELADVASRRSDMIDELHRENSTLRAGEVREAVAPIVRGIARLADDLARMRLGDGAQSADLAFLDARVWELLHDCGVLPERPELGAAFDPRLHHATGQATTADESAGKTIAEVRRAGLRRDDGRILRPADVVVLRYVAPVSPPPAEPAAADAPEPEPEPDAGASDDTAGKEEVA